MDPDVIKVVVSSIIAGGNGAVVAILVSIIGLLVWDRRALVKSISDTTQKVFDAKDSESKSIREIVDRYHQGNLDLIQALNEIKLVLMTIQNKR